MILGQRLRIVIPGGTGRLGTILARHFHQQGHAVTVLSRQQKKTADWQVVSWTGADLGPWSEALEGSDVVINLAGKDINCRHTAKHSRQIRDSRVLSTDIVRRAIAAASNPPSLWINASNVSIYPHSLDRAMGESAVLEPEPFDGIAPAWALQRQVITAAEDAFFLGSLPHTRRLALRTAMVMSPDHGGVFDKLLRRVRLGVGGPCGSGKQYVSWIHQTDFIRVVECLIARTDLEGGINVCSPCPLWNQRFMRCLRQAWCTTYLALPLPSWFLSVAGFALRSEPGLVLKSRYVVPTRLVQSGFQFHFPDWRGAAHDLVERWRALREQTT